jgi:hypothetical protein
MPDQRFEYRVIAENVEVISVIDGREHRLRGSGRLPERPALVVRAKLKGPLRPEDADREYTIYQERVPGVMELRVSANVMATLLAGAKLTTAADAIERGDERIIRDLRDGLIEHVKIPDERLAFLGEAIWSGAWRTGPGLQRERLGLKFDTMLSRLKNEIETIARRHELDGRTNSKGKIDPLIAAVSRDIIEPLYDRSGEIISHSLADQVSYEHSAAPPGTELDVDLESAAADSKYGRHNRKRREFLLRKSMGDVDYRADAAEVRAFYNHRPDLAAAVLKHSKRVIAAPQITNLNEGAYLERIQGGAVWTHCYNRDL